MIDEYPPGSRLPSVIQALQYGARPYEVLRRNTARFGELWTLRLPRSDPYVVVTNPEDVQRIFALSPDHVRHEDLDIILNLGRNSLVFLDGERHKRERRLLTPALHGAHLQVLGQVMQTAARGAIERLRPGRDYSLHAELQRLTLEIIIAGVYGMSEGPRAETLRDQMTAWLDGTLSPGFQIGAFLYGPAKLRAFLERQAQQALRHQNGGSHSLVPWRRLGQLKAAITTTLREEIARGRDRGVEGRADILAMLLQARDTEGEPLDDQHIIDELITLLVGGHETTANTLTWVVYQLMRRPAVVDQLRRELHDTLGDAPLDPMQPQAVPLIDAVISETMRLYPIAPAVPRQLARPLELHGYRLPAGTVLLLAGSVVHRRPDLWKDPDRFDPARFVGQTYPAHHYFPFGGGKRRCIGRAFALYEMRLLLAELVRHADFFPTDRRARHGAYRGITAAPSPEVVVRYVPRRV